MIVKSNKKNQLKFKKVGMFTLKDPNCLWGLMAIGEPKAEETSETETTPLCTPWLRGKARWQGFKDDEKETNNEEEKQWELQDNFTTSAIWEAQNCKELFAFFLTPLCFSQLSCFRKDCFHHIKQLQCIYMYGERDR